MNGEERDVVGLAMVGSDGKMLITMEALREAFGSGLAWDLSGLTQRLSSAASLFEHPGSGSPLGWSRPKRFSSRAAAPSWVGFMSGTRGACKTLRQRYNLSQINNNITIITHYITDKEQY